MYHALMGIATGVALPEGSVVTLLTPDSTGEVFLDLEAEAALIEAIAEAERGETISPEELFARMDKRAKQ